LRKTGLPVIAWVLAGLLVIAGALISLGQQDQSADPEAKSYGPSGISAFAELLRQNGINVAINQQSKPKLSHDDIAVAFRVIAPPQKEDIVLSQEEPQSPEERFQDTFWQFVKDGGSGIVLPLSKDFLEASRDTKDNPSIAVKDLASGETMQLTSGGVLPEDGFELPEVAADAVEMELWTDSREDSFLRAYRIGKGTALVARDAIGATNRFIDKNDNAKAFSSLVSMLAGTHKRVVFTEASFGNVNDPGLLETVGPWANAAWQQLIVLGLVVVFTLGKRFGTPDEARPVQRGAREMLDAVADTFKRTQATKSALTTTLTAADIELRRVLKLPKDATRSERDRLIPASLQNALTRLQVASEYPSVAQDHALDLIIRTQAELDEYIGPNRAKMRSLAKLRT